MVWKKVNNGDAGTSTKHGGNDIDKIADSFNGNDVSDPIIFNIDRNTLKHSGTNAAGDLLKSDGTKFVRFPRGTANQVLTTNAGGTDLAWSSSAGGGATTLDGLGDVAITSAARGDIIVRDATQFVNKAKGTANQFLRMDGTGTDPVWSTYSASYPVSTVWRMYIDPTNSKVTATNGTTTITNGTGPSDTDASEVIMDIFDNVGATAQFSIYIDPGSYTLRSWDESRTRRGNFSIIGSGMGATKLIVTNDIEDIAGDSRGLSFEAAAGSTTTNLSANCAKGSPSISVTSASGFAVGDDIILCSNADWDSAFAGADRTQMNRIVSISGTTMMLEKFAGEDFNTADTARIIKQTVLRNIYLADFSIEADSGYNNTGTTWLRFDFCDNLQADNIGIVGVLGNFHTGLVTNMVTNSRLRNFKMELPASMGHFTTSGPYAISCRAACYNVAYENFTFLGGWRHCFTTTTNQENVKDGVPKKIYVVNPSCETCSEAALDTHGEGEDIYFINPVISGWRSADSTDTVAGTADTDCINLRNRNVTIINPMISNTRGNGINITTQGYGHKIIGGTFRYIRNGFNAINISSGHDIQISGGNFDQIDKSAILIGTNVYNVQMSDLHMTNCCTADDTLSPIEVGSGVHDCELNGIMIDTSNDADIAPISLSSTSYNFTLSNIILTGAGKDCDLSGFNHKLNHLTCIGRNLEKPNRKIGRWDAGTPGGGSGLFAGNATATGGTRRIETTDGLFQEFVTSTLNQVQGVKSTNNYTERDLNPYIRFTFRVETLTLMRMFLLWTGNDSSLGPAGTDPLANNSGIGLKLASGGTNFEIYHNSGDATSTTGAAIGTADTNRHVFEMRADNANSKFQYRYDFGTWTDISTDIPSSTSDLCFQAYMENNESGVSKDINLLEVETSHDNK